MKVRKIILNKEQVDFLIKLGKTPVSVKTDRQWLKDNGYEHLVEELTRLKQVRWSDGELEPFAAATW